MSRSSSAYSVKVAQICFALGFLGLVLFGLASMMKGNNTKMTLVVGAVCIFVIVFLLDARYWILPVFCFGYYENMPFIRLSGAELGCLVLVFSFFGRMSLHCDLPRTGVKKTVLAALPFFLWVCIVWGMNPTGLNILGNSVIGGRFYVKIGLSFFAMICLSRLRFNDSDCKILIWAIGCGYLAHTLFSVLFGSSEEQLMGSGIHYVFIPLSFVAPLFLCRFSAPELLVRGWPFLGFCFCFGLSFYSGNRTAAFRTILVGLMAPLFIKRDQFKTAVLVVVVGFFIAFLVAGQGNVWHLPFAIQRPLSFLPGRWDRRLEAYGFNDDFRAELRFWARQHIKEHPWFGDGGFSLDFGDMVWGNALAQRGGFSADIAGHVLARNWHNVWYGMAADFGIPLSVFWGIFMTVLLVHGYQGTKRLPAGSWWQTAYLYFYLMILTEFVNFFFNGGHTALTAQQLFLWAGLMMAVLNGVDTRMRLGDTRE